MSRNTSDYLRYVTESIAIDFGFFILITGFIGNLLNIITFLTLKTFRETSCAFYLTTASCANLIHLVVSLLSRILITGYNIDLTHTSSFACKLRQYIAMIAPLMALYCMCLATIDQYATLTLRWRHFSRRTLACRFVVMIFVFWCLVNIPVIVYYDTSVLSIENQWQCLIINMNYKNYFSRFYITFLLGFIQLTIRTVFGLLAFINVRRLRNRQRAIIRLERDKQITSMVLFETVIDVLLSLPFFIYYAYKPYILTTDAADVSLYTFIITTTTNLNYAAYAIGFYIYCCVSSRFRKQVFHVVVGIHMKYCCKMNVTGSANQIAPCDSGNQTVSLELDIRIDQC
ncbi:unnamed protein product [Adineta ricciae]|uniref:G-protein coupled receptors family 1 profile domain-containing protein n=1 Tax=Adineta ricciae TaxID=249248 RepID=A0A813WC10_ADIRI|nr:unnamed protein product [Adineta ricciae]